MNKIFLPYDRVRNNALKLAHRIHCDGFVPDVIYVLLRGGAYIGNVISEYFKIVRRKERPVFYAAVVARSYTNIRQHSQVMVDGWTYKPEHLRHGDKVLLVDDIFDTGRTINHLVGIINAKGIPREDIKVAVHDYKTYAYQDEELPVQPDYYCVKHDILSKEEDIWIHYMSHELVGLTEDELKKNYVSAYEDLAPIFKELFKT